MPLLFLNGNMLAPGRTPAGTAVAVCDGTIRAVGPQTDLLAQAGPDTRIVDLAGRTLVPGFIDSHAHLWKIGHLLTSMLDLRETTGFADLGALLQARSHNLPAKAWLLGRGFNEASLAERRRPDRHTLDAFVADRPVVLTRTCGHIFAANSLALRLAGIDAQTQAPAGGVIERDAAGEPNGLLHETAMGLLQHVIPAHSAADYEAMILAGMKHQLALGITSTSDCGVLPELLQVYLGLDRRGGLPSRINVMPLGVPDGAAKPFQLALPRQYNSPKLRVDTIKFLADGGLSGSTAALGTPYLGTDSRGVLRFDAADLRALFHASTRAEWNIATHAIGDAAIEQVLSLYEEMASLPRHGRLRIEHLGLPHPRQIERLALAGVAVSTQPTFLYELAANFRSVVPVELSGRIYPFREMLQAGMAMAFSSDAPVVADDSPLRAIQAAVLRRSREGYTTTPGQAVTAAQALHAYTTAGAQIAGDEHDRGSLQPGLFADFAVLSADPTQVAAESLADIRVEQTWLGGTLVYRNDA